MVVLWVSRPHLSMDNSLRCPWGLHLTYRYILLRARVTATATGAEVALASLRCPGTGTGPPRGPGRGLGAAPLVALS